MQAKHVIVIKLQKKGKCNFKISENVWIRHNWEDFLLRFV